jgi:hypothetical protein
MERDVHRNFHDLAGDEMTISKFVAPSGYLCFCIESRTKIELIFLHHEVYINNNKNYIPTSPKIYFFCITKISLLMLSEK